LPTQGVAESEHTVLANIPSAINCANSEQLRRDKVQVELMDKIEVKSLHLQQAVSQPEGNKSPIVEINLKGEEQ